MRLSLPPAAALVALAMQAGCTYEKGDLTAEEVGELREQAEAGALEAAMIVGEAYETGEGVEEDPGEAEKWYRKAAEQGFGPAQFALGALYAEGGSLPPNREEAIEWFEKAALKGDPVAQFNLGTIYIEEGEGQDFGEALKWFRAASFQGDLDALHALGIMYEQGDGVLQSDGEAYKFYKRAADEGHPGGMYGLASLYEGGRGVEQDFEKAIYYYKEAADDYFDGIAQASNDLAWLYATCRVEELRNGRQAVKYALKATADSPQDYYFHDTLAAAYARAGWFEDAVAAAEWAIELVEADEELEVEDREEIRADFAERLALYRASEAYADPGE